MNNISFDNPWLLFIALPLIAAVLIPFFITVRRDNANFHNVAAVSLNIIVCLCLTLVISGMTFETVITETNVYVLADVSYSSEHSLDKVQENVEKISKKLPKNSKMGVICFGRNYQLISDLGEKTPDIRTADKVDRSATDIGSALRYAGNLFEPDVIKRIIVITDGAETVSSNNLVKVVNNLQDNGVYVDAVYLDDNLPDNVKELQIDAVEATSSTYVGKTEEVNILIRANCGVNADGAETRIDGYVNLYRDGELEKRQPATFYSGLNSVTVPLSTDKAGSSDYRVTVEPVNPSDDYSSHNNVSYFSQSVTADKKVLFIGASDADLDAGRRVYGTKDVMFVSQVNQIPLSVEDLYGYDEIAMSNFDVRTMGGRGGVFLDCIDMLVKNYGKTFTTFGNTFIHDTAHNKDSTDAELLAKLQDLLPVNIGNNDQDTRLVTLILDISTSMNYSGRFDIAKRAAMQLLDVLNKTDTVMVIGFSGGAKILLPPTKLTSPSAVKKAINEITAENMTNISNALEIAYNNMPARFYNKQVIMISDGLNPVSDEAAAKGWAETMCKEGIVFSAVGVYPPEYGDKLLNAMVNNPYKGKDGEYQNIKHESEIDIVIQGIGENASEVKIEGDSYEVTAQRPGDEVFNNVGKIGAVNGFWYNSVKPAAHAVLTAKYERDRLNKFDVPVYAYWNGGGGNGKVVSFLSDLTNGWVSGWSSGTEGDKFLSNIPMATLPDERIHSPFIIDVQGQGNSTMIYVKASSNIQAGADFKISVTSPENVVTSKSLTFSQGEYFASFATDAPGKYSVHLEYSYEDIHYEADSDFSVSYYAEYDGFATFSKSYLYRLLSENGSILELDELEVLENTDSDYTSFIFDFTMPLMITAAVLFVVGITVRQLKWKDVTSFFSGLFRRRK